MGSKKTYFNGVAFDSLLTDESGGERIKEHKFNKKGALITTHGENNQQITLSVIHFDDANSTAAEKSKNLIATIKRNSGGILIHPDIGEISVKYKSFSRSINTNAKNIVKSKLKFIQQKSIALFSTNLSTLLSSSVEALQNKVVSDTVDELFSGNSAYSLGQFSEINPEFTAANTKDEAKIILANTIKMPFRAVSSPDFIVQEFQAKHKALSLSTLFAGKKFTSKQALTTESTIINLIFNNPKITNSLSANEFYNLKSIISRSILENNSNLPAIKTAQVGKNLPEDYIKNQYGDNVTDLNDNFHPLFAGNEQKYT